MIAVIGASGQLGSAFVRLLGERAHPVTRAHFDLRDPGAMAHWFGETEAKAVINCAAYNAVDQAEDDEEAAREINATAVGRLAGLSAGIGARFITFSTDYVFDGQKTTPYVESDQASPLSAYGRTKLEGETLARDNSPDSLVVRTSALLSATHPNFASRILESLRRGPIEVIDDQVTCPTNVDDLARATLEALERGITGILHLAGGEAMSWYELATSIVTHHGLPGSLVIPVSCDSYPSPARRPKNSVLSSERIDRAGLSPVPSIRTGLGQLVAALNDR